MIATSERVPLISSDMRSSIGCENENPMSGSASASRFDIASTSASRELVVTHSSGGFRMMIASESSTPIGSVAISARPVFDTTVITSGNSRSTFSKRVAPSTLSSRDTLGRRSTWIARAPSSRRGTNSAPMREPIHPATPRKPKHMTMIARGAPIVHPSTGG